MPKSHLIFWCGKYVEFGAVETAFLQNFCTRKLGEILLFYAVKKVTQSVFRIYIQETNHKASHSQCIAALIIKPHIQCKSQLHAKILIRL